MKPIYIIALTLLGSLWGASFMFIRVASPVFGPFLLMFVRVLIAVLALLAYAAYLRQIPDLRAQWRQFLVLGALNSGLPFVLIAFSALTLTSSLTAILNSTTPLFTALVAAVWIGERLTPRKIIGVLMGIVGVAILAGGSPLELTPAFVIAVLASLAAALCYGLGTVYASRITGDLKGFQAAIGQLLGATVVLAVPAVATPAPAPITLPAVAALIALALLSTSFAYLLYFYLLRHVGPTRTATVTFLVPLFGTFWGVLLLGEALSIGLFIGMAVILASVSLVIGARKPKVPAPNPS